MLGVPGTQVPGGGHHQLEVADLAVFDAQPVRQAAARGIDEAHAASFPGHAAFHGDLLVAAGDVGFVFGQPLFHLLGDDQGLDAAGGGTAQGGEQGFRSHAQSGKDLVHRGLHGFMALGIGHQHLGQRAGLHGQAVIARRLEPGVAVRIAHAGEGGLCLAIIGGAGLLAFIPAVAHMLGDLAGIEGMHGIQLAVQQHAGLEPALGDVAFAAHFGEFAKGHEVAATAAQRGPVLVGTGHQQQVGDVDFFDEFAGLQVQVAEFLDAPGRQRFVTGHAAGDQELGVRVLGAEHGHGLGGADLHAQGFQIVGRGHEVGFGIQIIGRMPAQEIGVGEGAQLAAVHKGLQAGLHGLEVIGRGLAGRDGRGQRRGLGRIGLEGGGHVYEVQGVQVIEVHHVVVHEQQAQHQIADIGGIGGQGQAHGVFQGAGGGQGVGVGAHAAGTLGEVLGIAGVTALEDHFQTAIQGAAAAGILDAAVLHFHLDAQMAFDTGQRVNDDGTGKGALGRFHNLAHAGSSLVLVKRRQVIPEIGLAATDAGMSGPHGPVGLVEQGLGAVVVGAGPLAAQVVQTPALARFLGIEGRRELARVEMDTAFAQVVHGLTVEHERTAQIVELDLFVLQKGHQRAHQVQGVGRAARDIDGLHVHAQFGEAVIDAHGAGGVGLGGLHAAVSGTGAHGDHGLGLGQHALAQIQHGVAAHIAVLAVHGRGDGAFHHADEAFGIADGLFQRGLGGFARGGHDGFVIIQGDGVQDQGVEEGFAGAQQGLGTARAFSAVQIDHGGAAIGQRRGHFRGHAGPKAHGHGHGRAEFQKITTADALLRQTFLPTFFAQTNGNTHTCLLSAG